MSTASPKVTSRSRASGAKSRPKTSGAARGKRPRTVLSEMVTRRARDMAALLASIRVHKASVAAGLSERFAPTLRMGETVPDHALTLDLAGRCVQLAFERLDELDDRHDLAKANRAYLARELDRTAKQELYPQAVVVRRQIDDTFGRKAGCDLHTFTGKTPRTPARLKQHVQRAVSRLGTPNRIPPVSRNAVGEPVARQRHQVEDWQRRLRGPLGKLTDIDDNLSRQKAELNTLRGQRQQAMQHFDAVYAEAIRLVEAAFLMAGIRGQLVKSLRSYTERRRLARWAKRKRAARNTTPTAIADAEASSAESARRSIRATAAAISRWLRQRWIFG